MAMLPSRMRAARYAAATADPASVVAALAGVRGTAAQVTRDQRVRIAMLTGIFPLIFGTTISGKYLGTGTIATRHPAHDCEVARRSSDGGSTA
jgi:hypothetical protein